MPELSGFRKLMSAAVEWAASAEHITGICLGESAVSPGSLRVRLSIKNHNKNYTHSRIILADMKNASEEVIANQIKIQLDDLLSDLVKDIPRREASK